MAVVSTPQAGRLTVNVSEIVSGKEVTHARNFSGLKAGAIYVAFVGGVRVATVRVVDRPGPASRLIVKATDRSDAVRLSWQHTPTITTGGAAIRYDVVAKAAESAKDAAGAVKGPISYTVTLGGREHSVTVERA